MRPFVAIGDEVWVGRPLDPPSHFQQAAFATGSRAQLEAGGGVHSALRNAKRKKRLPEKGGGVGQGGADKKQNHVYASPSPPSPPPPLSSAPAPPFLSSLSLSEVPIK